jgi:hypothetical protein
VAWLAYSIHGDETSGSDASQAVLYHLIASRDADVRRLLDEMVVIIDPMMNPDGRGRWAQQLAEHRGAMPNVDDQSLLHAGYWPFGRMNHYLFDLNRDWILGVHPETRGRIRAAGAWHPLLFVDAHEMGSQDTYLFAPSRLPNNPHVPEFQAEWNTRFARDQAAAFDRHRWTYYTGEWNEGWYPGYSDAWASFRGAIAILYEQAGVSEDAVRRAGGSLLPYRESVHHQMVSSLANLESLRANALQVKEQFLAHRRQAVSAEGPYARRTFAILPTPNRGRLEQLLELMELQGIEVYEAATPFTADRAVDQLGRESLRLTIPEGAILIPNLQPEAHLVATMLEFDTRMSPEYLKRERMEVLRTGRSTIYDVTAWSITMMYGLEALTLEATLPEDARRVPGLDHGEGTVEGAEGANFYVFDGADDRSVGVAGRLMEAGMELRVADRALELGGRRFARGSVVVIVGDNERIGFTAQDVASAVEREARDSGLGAVGVVSGLGEGDLPDIGGRHFKRLEPPRIAIVARGGVSGYDFGSIWHMLDRKIGIRHSHIGEDAVNFSDLRRYNVLVLPHRWFGQNPESLLKGVQKWVEAGGTLIAVGSSAGDLAAKDAEISKVRTLTEALGELDKYELSVQREWMARRGEMPDADLIWSHVAAPGAAGSGEMPKSGPRPSAEELKRQDSWQKLFMPPGTFLAGRVDDEHWLTFGTGEPLPILIAESPVLMSADGVDSPVRFGVLSPVPEGRSGSGDKDLETGAERRVGWAAVPEGVELRLRMSGLLWSEAANRIANSAYVTRESVGSGQVILFAAPAVFRGATLGTARLLANALVYGPGLGASHPIKP